MIEIIDVKENKNIDKLNKTICIKPLVALTF